MEGFLEKKGKRFGFWVKRWYVINGNLLDYYTDEGKQILSGSVTLHGVKIVEGDNLLNERGLLFPFDIESTAKADDQWKRTFYCKSDEERTRWVSALKLAGA